MRYGFVTIVLTILMSTLYAGSALADSPGKQGTAPMDDETRNSLRYTLAVELFPERATLTGRVQARLSEGRFTLDAGSLTIERLMINGTPTALSSTLTITGPAEVSIEYSGIFNGSTSTSDNENPGVVNEGLISPEGVSLTAQWYPRIHAENTTHGYYALRATMPGNFMAVSEADSILSADLPGNRVEYAFVFSHPLQGINLVAGPYVEISDTYNETEIYGYFFRESVEIGKDYVIEVKRYLDLYESLIGPYPFSRFSVVENILPTGYAMPTFTLLGSSVIRLPFIVKTSLGHEVLHQWFGDAVGVNYAQGNWSEGLATYLADHLYEDQQGNGSEYRKNILLDYRNYVRSGKDFPLSAFASRTDPASRSIGYGKSAMVFHMLRGEIGESAFINTIRGFYDRYRFKEASWGDFAAMVNTVTGEDYGWFFHQWVEHQGLPSFSIVNPRFLLLGGKYRVSFTIEQSGPEDLLYRFSLPIIIMTDNDMVNKVIEVKGRKTPVEMEMSDTPRELVIDDGYYLMRPLTPAETPPVISSLMGDKDRIVVYPQEKFEIYEPIVEAFKQMGFSAKSATEVKDSDLKDSSVVAMEFQGPLLRNIFGVRPTAEDAIPLEGVVLVCLENPLNPGHVIAGIHAENREEAEAAANRLRHYGKYSIVRFKGGRNMEKTVSKSDNGIRHELATAVVGFKPTEAIPLERIIEDVIKRDVIYVGEGHTNYEHHLVQLEIIKAMQASGRPFAIGMEMFQNDFQQSLDDYIAEESDERQFLLDSEYFVRWKFNYHLYREILDFARHYGINVVALNLNNEIVRTAARQGLDSLTEEQRAALPPDMDLSDWDYRNRLRKIFFQHAGASERSFTNFYQAQILWDETMAHSVVNYLSGHPDEAMIVLAGQGHVAYGSGIPNRVSRLLGRNGDDSRAIIIHAGEDFEPGMADYVLIAPAVTAPESPALGIAIEDHEGGVLVTQVQAGSLAERMGIKQDDLITGADGGEITNVAQLKVALFYKESGQSMTLRVSRKRILFGRKDLTLSIDFP